MTGGKFSYRTEEELLAAAESQGAPLSLSHDLSALKTPLAVPGSDVTLKNRLTVHPMEGFDSLPDGGPGELTLRRIRRMASGGAGLVWAEATAVTAAPLRPELRKKLTLRLADLTGKRVDLQNRVDPSVLGGLRLEYEGKSLDGTVRQRLDGISKTLSETVL